MFEVIKSPDIRDLYVIVDNNGDLVITYPTRGAAEEHAIELNKGLYLPDEREAYNG